MLCVHTAISYSRVFMLDSGFDTFFKGVKILHSGSFCLLLLCPCMLLQHIDIDECADRNMSACSQLCVNSVGSYRCECEKGYFLEEDGQTCTKGERGETSLFSSRFPFYPKKTDGVFSPADIWEPLHSPASCEFLFCSDFLAALEKTSQMVPTTTESVFAPYSVIAVGERGIWGRGGV